MRALHLFFAFILLAAAGYAEEKKSYWLTEERDAVVALTVGEDGVLAGRIVWLEQDEDEPDKDINNPDPELRGRDLVGLEIVTGFKRSSQNKWKGGEVYDPESGKTYYGKLEFEGDTLKLRGSLDKWGLLGRSATWTRTEFPLKKDLQEPGRDQLVVPGNTS